MLVRPSEHDIRDVYKLLIGAVVPRPIGFISTTSRDGIRNLAPYSFFNAVCQNPPVVLFSSGIRAAAPGNPNERRKDSLRNVQETGEFVVNIVSEDFAEAMNAASGDYPFDVDEFEVSGLTPVRSELVTPCRVKEARVSMECKLMQTVMISDRPGGACLVIGEVVLLHVDDDIVDNYRIDPGKLRAIGRMGGNTYTRTSDRFDLARPKV
ncbi:MAG: flavin reductase family protein [Acidobacteria bacterium]|nr:flavin reductase family protein [Acidobacteriota bacterium]